MLINIIWHTFQNVRLYVFLTAMPQPVQQGPTQINITQASPMQGNMYPMQQPAPGTTYPG